MGKGDHTMKLQILLISTGAIILTGCASGPPLSWHQTGVESDVFDSDLAACDAAGRDAMNGVSTPYYHPPAGSSTAAAAGGAFGAGFARGLAQGQARIDARRNCFVERGYRLTMLTDDEAAYFHALDTPAERQAYLHQIAAEERDASTFPEDESSTIPEQE